MANGLLGWNNRITTATLTGTSEQTGLGVTQLQNEIGDASTAWQTLNGAKLATLIINSGSAASTWRAFLLARTNLTTTAFVRWRVGTVEAVVEEVPTYDFVYTSGSITTPAGYTFSRASKGWAFDSTGTLTEYANNVLRFTYDPVSLACLGVLREEARTNSIRNPRAEGAVAGTPGTNPTNWNVATFGGTGITKTIVGTGTEQGIPYIDVRYNGTVATSALLASIRFESTTNIAAAVSQDWVASAYLRLIAGAWGSPSASPSMAITEYDSGGVQLSQTNTTITVPTNAVLASQRYTMTRTTAGATCAFVVSNVQVSYNVGAVVDFTLRVGIPQLERGTIMSSPMMPAVGTPAAFTRAQEVCSITGLSISLATGFSVYYDNTWDDDTGQGPDVPWSLTPATNAFGDSTYTSHDKGFAQVSLTQLDTVHGDGPGITRGSVAAGIATKVCVSEGPAGKKMAVNALAIQTSATVPTQNGVYTKLGIGGGSWGGGAIGGSTGIATWRRFTFYAAKQLTSGQVSAMAAGGVTLDTTAVTYDSGTVSAGLVAGFGQSVITASTQVTGQYARVDINDINNPDGYLNIPLAYAGPVWQPSRNVSPASTQGRDDATSEVRTRGGQEFPILQYVGRRWDLDFQGVLSTELWTSLDDLDRNARRGINVLFVPDPSSTDVNRATIYGRLKARADVSYFAGGPSTRAWKATISERL